MVTDSSHSLVSESFINETHQRFVAPRHQESDKSIPSIAHFGQSSLFHSQNREQPKKNKTRPASYCALEKLKRLQVSGGHIRHYSGCINMFPIKRMWFYSFWKELNQKKILTAWKSAHELTLRAIWSGHIAFCHHTSQWHQHHFASCHTTTRFIFSWGCRHSHGMNIKWQFSFATPRASVLIHRNVQNFSAKKKCNECSQTIPWSERLWAFKVGTLCIEIRLSVLEHSYRNETIRLSRPFHLHLKPFSSPMPQ